VDKASSKGRLYRQQSNDWVSWQILI
jgi:hypothetical protein